VNFTKHTPRAPNHAAKPPCFHKSNQDSYQRPVNRNVNVAAEMYGCPGSEELSAIADAMLQATVLHALAVM
jgi:hypothetical protein